MLRIIAVTLVVATVGTIAQYPASGWRPEGAQFRLPLQYGAPLILQPQVQLQITRENVEYAGQIVETTTEQQLPNEYIPPTTTEQQPEQDTLKVQGLPQTQQQSFVPQQAALPQNVQQRQPVFPVNGQLRAFPFGGFQQFAQRQQQPKPAQTYGPPATEEPKEQDGQEPQEQPEEATPTTEQPEDGDAENDGQTVVAVANSFNGQYYILTPENTLQRVVYSTKQTDDDRRVNGFTAELRYSPVEPIRDPVYSYNEEGQLVQIYKKK